MAELKIGTEYTIKAQVTEPMTARQMGSGQAEVLATPSLLALMEQAAWTSVAPMLEEGQSTVGTFARLTAVDRRKLSFFIEAFDAAEKVAEAEHERFVIDSAKFMAKAESKKQCE